MADTPPAPSSEASTPSSNAADQARIRKERREAKIRAGGSARLDKITGLGGGVQRDVPRPKPAIDPTADPEEVDISEHFYAPARTSRPQTPSFTNPAAGPQISDEQLRALMLGAPLPGNSPSAGAQGNPFAGFPGMEGLGMGGAGADTGMMGADGEDPMMKMLQQMMAGMGGEGGSAPGAMPSFPGMPSMPMPGSTQASDPYAYLWRIIHAIFALSLGFYIAITAPGFSGTKLDRELSALGSLGGGGKNYSFFYIFATAEVVLQTSRYWIESRKGAGVQRAGVLGMLLGALPEPYRGYLALALRYGRIWTTVSADAMVCLFVLGVSCWLKGSV